jgi:hypothetical protein
MTLISPTTAPWQSKSLLALIISAGIFLPISNSANGDDASSADPTADRMLEALGGRQAWAELRNTVNGSQQSRVDQPTDVYAVITMDFQMPRFRIETTARDLHVIRVIDGDRSWRLRRSGDIEDVPDELFEDELRWYNAHLYRTIHRIAARDPEISLGLDDQERLQVFERGERIMWFRLDADGEPFVFGTYDDEVGSLLGPWTFQQDGIHHPAWVSSSDGTWRAAVKALSVNVPLKDHMFARPDVDN